MRYFALALLISLVFPTYVVAQDADPAVLSYEACVVKLKKLPDGIVHDAVDGLGNFQADPNFGSRINTLFGKSLLACSDERQALAQSMAGRMSADKRDERLRVIDKALVIEGELEVQKLLIGQNK